MGCARTVYEEEYETMASLDERPSRFRLPAFEQPVSRRTFLRGSIGLAAAVPAVATLLAACAEDDDTDDAAPAADPDPDDDTDDDDTPDDGDEVDDEDDPDAVEDDTDDVADDDRYGGRLEVAMIGEPPTLDIHQTTGTIVAMVAWNMYETLFSWDDEFNVIPMLAESHDVSDDGLTHTVTLREGVPFHNGEIMTAADVIASLEHWAEIHGLGGNLIDATDELVEVDDHTIEFRLNRPFGIFTSAVGLANGGAAIYPKSVIDAGEGEMLTEYVGTGPYQFVHWQPDREILLERFDDYAALEGETNGYGGRKMAYVDEIRFIPVTDEASRIAGLRSGEFHYLENIAPDQYEAIADDEVAIADILPPMSWGVFILNMRSPIMGELNMRKAFQAALDLDMISLAGFGEGFYRLDPGLMIQETVWHTTAGEEYYNMDDPELAAELLEEAGYDGEPIVWTTTQEYSDHYDRSAVATQQLEDAGFNIDLQVKDWATVLSEQFDPEAWDITTTGITFRPDPALLFLMDVCNVAGWWCSDEVIELVGDLRSESDFDVRFEIWEQIQQLAYEEVPFVKNADALRVVAMSRSLQNFSPLVQLAPILWNVWLDE
jgi:peptide/nickel transport system substrate-binding protein